MVIMIIRLAHELALPIAVSDIQQNRKTLYLSKQRSTALDIRYVLAYNGIYSPVDSWPTALVAKDLMTWLDDGTSLYLPLRICTAHSLLEGS